MEPAEEQEAELRELREWGEEISRAENGGDEPGCVMRAFARRGEDSVVLTMQGWADLEAIRSPILRGVPFVDVEEMTAAARVFGLDLSVLDDRNVLLVLEEMRDAVHEGFAMVLPMNPPGKTEPGGGLDGFGAWLPIFSCLVTECGLSVTEALARPVGQAFALIAGMRHNQGWRASGTPYALRDLGNGECPQDAAKPEPAS